MGVEERRKTRKKKGDGRVAEEKKRRKERREIPNSKISYDYKKSFFQFSNSLSLC